MRLVGLPALGAKILSLRHVAERGGSLSRMRIGAATSGAGSVASMSDPLTGQGALVAGAGSGIGRALAESLGARGMHVYCIDRDGPAVEQTAAGIREAGGRASAEEVDITDAAAVAGCFAAAARELGQIHAMVNSAGVQGPLGMRSHEVDVTGLDATYAVNLRGAFLLSNAALTHMLGYRYGRIVHIASIAGKDGNPNMVCYSATKAGLIGMVKSQGKEYAHDGITVNAIAPAVIRTPFLDTQPPEVIDYMTARIPMGRVGTVGEVADLVAFVIAPQCSFTTGFVFDLSGGRATY